ncbi:MAG: prepilin-type N-terminal cleavage/methylation domain-containing protein [Betaproteobacteria bacterium]
MLSLLSPSRRVSKRHRMAPQVRRQHGVGLVELLIAAAIGLFLLAGLTDFLSRSLVTSGRNLQDARLTQDLNVAMDLITRDLRRAGFSSGAQGSPAAISAPPNPFTLDTPAAVAGSADGGISLATAGCVLYAYDLPASQDGALNAAERLGFRLQAGAVQAGTSATGCAAGTWQDITDPRLSTVTVLTFQYLDGNGVAAAPQMPFVAATGVAAGVTRTVCTRLIQVTLTGQLRGDPNVTHTLTQSVRVRNDWYRTGTATCA